MSFNINIKRNNKTQYYKNQSADTPSNVDNSDLRFDSKGIHQKIMIKRLENEINNIVPSILDNIADDVILYCDTLKQIKEQDNKMRERLNLS